MDYGGETLTNKYNPMTRKKIEDMMSLGYKPVIVEHIVHKEVGPGVPEVTEESRRLEAQLLLDHLRHDAMISECRQREHLFDQDALQKRLKELK